MSWLDSAFSGATGSGGWLGPAIGAAASLGGAYLQSNAAEDAADRQAQGLSQATQATTQNNAGALALYKAMYEQGRDDLAPYRGVGPNALGALQNQIGTDYTKSPGYQFRLNEGLNAAQQSAAARGSLNSGATLRGLTEYGQNFATNDYNNWLQRLSGLATIGQNSAAGSAAAGQNFAGQAGQTLTNQGNSLAQLFSAGGANAASGAVAQGNAWNNGIQNALVAYSRLGQ